MPRGAVRADGAATGAGTEDRAGADGLLRGPVGREAVEAEAMGTGATPQMMTAMPPTTQHHLFSSSSELSFLQSSTACMVLHLWRNSRKCSGEYILQCHRKLPEDLGLRLNPHSKISSTVEDSCGPYLASQTLLPGNDMLGPWNKD